MDSPYAACRPRNHHCPTMMAMPAVLELGADIGDCRIKHLDEQGIQMQVVSYGSLAGSFRSARLSLSRRTRWTGPHNLPARPGRKDLP